MGIAFRISQRSGFPFSKSPYLPQNMELHRSFLPSLPPFLPFFLPFFLPSFLPSARPFELLWSKNMAKQYMFGELAAGSGTLFASVFGFSKMVAPDFLQALVAFWSWLRETNRRHTYFGGPETHTYLIVAAGPPPSPFARSLRTQTGAEQTARMRRLCSRRHVAPQPETCSEGWETTPDMAMFYPTGL